VGSLPGQCWGPFVSALTTPWERMLNPHEQINLAQLTAAIMPHLCFRDFL